MFGVQEPTITRPYRDCFVDAGNILEASIKNNQGRYVDFDFEWYLKSEEIPEYRKGREDAHKDRYHFTLLREEVQFMLNPESKFSPWFDDGIRAVKLTYNGIFAVPTYHSIDGEITRFQLRMRWAELKVVIQKALDLPDGCAIDYRAEIIRSKEMAKPNFTVEYTPEASHIRFDETNRQRGIQDRIDYVIKIAENSSNGQDDPVVVCFMQDSERSLYWNIQNMTANRRVMNGGIIWHEGPDGAGLGEYSIHT